ncbi:hypothetical protein CO033_00360 [Candidatus Nomurabacteria bacterium CG_4_9_14_0_2_um_filter_32_10]|uniref:Uncharacterized protein n=3 Tax=Candidatus Nomuraibacteriota TaxID=1752729 RepID=A0A2H0CFR2_9BACT|nr:MAG: hypothetical protein COW91_03115 [Candidatus Nomurabacteria bacterium CG22_combo_CG10-13_8_21_14_all_32_8]PIZ86283.1 MAG: hypothetical protein COX94_00540 [Candidatus Nomurabacteria bacterium CG_4_10_14_0_2_um_filter_33_9]PJC49664.1 MAG: hypothetical protein CO033_00360 [Candidatus Nomurabacteria bacterium CG_4_9_14_0_2_um_filter_32_10]
MYTSDNPIIKDSFLGSKFLNPDYLFTHLSEFVSYVFTEKTLDVIYVFLSFLAIFFIAIIIYVTIRMFEIRAKEHAHLQHEIAEFAHTKALKKEELQEEIFKNKKWKKVLDYLFSDNENDWKLGIIEADLMLFDLLTQLGFKGENLGDKLKNANRESFRSLSSAWEVHNIRNKIAHEGSSFEVSLHEAKRVISLYELIFKEFGYI